MKINYTTTRLKLKMEAYCRGCLKEFEPTELLQYSESNRRLYVYCTGLQVKRNDAFIFQLCKECFIYLKLACKFKKQCRSSDRKFKTYLSLKSAGENIDFRSYMKSVEDTFTLKLPNANRGSTPLYPRTDDDDDDNESTCTSIQNFMTDIRETLQEEDVLTTEDNIIREVIQEEADISDDSLDSHWLEDDNVNDFGMDFNFSAIGTPLSSNEDRCNSPVRITTDEDDTCHYVHKDVILKSDKTITLKNKKGIVNDTERNAINETNAEFSDANFRESELAKASNQNDMPLLDDCDMALDGMMDANVSITGLESEFPIANVDDMNKKPVISNKEIASEESNNSIFATKLEFYSNNDVMKVKTDNLIESRKKEDIPHKAIDYQAFSLDTEHSNDSSKHYLEKTIQHEEPKVENELEQYIAKVKCKKEENKFEKCSIDKNLETALKNDGKQVFPLDQLLKSPHVSDQYSGGSTPIVHNILFGSLTPIHKETPEIPQVTKEILQIDSQLQLSQSPKVKDIDKADESEAESTVRIFKGTIKCGGNSIFNTKLRNNKNRGYKDIARLKHLLIEENMFEEKSEEKRKLCDSSDETVEVDEEFNKINESDDIMSEDEAPTLQKDEIVNGNIKDKVIQTPVTDDLDISITNLLDFDENQSVDLNISIASDFLEEEQKESISEIDEIDNDHIRKDHDVINEDEYEKDDKQQNQIDNKDNTHIDKEEQSEKVFKRPLPPPDDKFDLNKRLCKICNKKFKTVRALKLHFGKAHKLLLPRSERINVPKVCEMCGKVLADMVTYKRHLKIHEGPLKCSHCSLPFKTAGSLRLHMRSHNPNFNKPPEKTDKQTEQKKFLCILCDKEFKTSSNFHVHMRRHDKNYTIKCDFCNKGFVRKYDLQQHIIQHTKELPFSCEVCPKKFKSRYMLVGHMYIHMGIKKFACQTCDRQFETNQNLQQHYKTCQIKVT